MQLMVIPLSLSLVASSLWTPMDRWQPRTSLPRASSPAMSATALSDLKVYELKAVCRAKGLKVSGRKAELVERIMTSSVGGAAPPAPAKKSRAKKAASAAAAPPPTTIPPQSPLPPPAAGSTFDADVLSGPTSAMPHSANADAAVGGDAAPEVLSAEEGDEMEFRAQQRAPLVTCTRTYIHTQTHTHTHDRPSDRAAGHGRALERAPAAPPPPRRAASAGLWQVVTPPAGCPVGWLSPSRLVRIPVAGCHHALTLTLTLTLTRRAKRAARRGKLAGYFSEEYAKTVGGLESAAGASYAAAVGLGIPSIERVLIGGAPAWSICVWSWHSWPCVWSQGCPAAGARTRRSGSPLARSGLPSGPGRSSALAAWMPRSGGCGAREHARSRRLHRRP